MKTLLALLSSLSIAAAGYAQSAAADKKSAEAEAANYGGTKSAEAREAEQAPPRKAPVRIILPTKADPKAAAKKDEAAKKADSAKKGEKAKKEEPKIEGVVISRGEKGFLGVEIVGSAFKITFYDKKKEKVAPDVARAVLRWDPKYKVGQERIVLNPDADGKSLSNPRSIRPPHNFKLFITLINEAAESPDPAGETLVIDFRA